MDLTPEGLCAYFVKLAEATGLGMSAEDGEDADKAGPGVIRRGLAAAQMLMAIREVLGDPGAARPARAAASATAGDSGDSGEIEGLLAEKDREIAEAYTENDRLLVQNMEMGKTVKNLKGKVEIMQRQIERLYNKGEMQRTLQTIETKKLSAVEQLGEEGEGSDADDAAAAAENGTEAAETQNAGAEPAAEAAPPKPAAPKRSLNKELADELQIEAAVRAPREEKSE